MQMQKDLSEASSQIGVISLQDRERMLVRRCLRGDASAWETMITAYGGQVRSFIRRHVRVREEAEDLIQEVFLRLYRHLKTFRTDSGDLSHWLSRVGRNLVVDRYRRERHCCRRAGIEELEKLNLPDVGTASPEAETARSETARLLLQSLSTLTPEVQEALVLRYLEDLSYQEIAQKLGVPDGTVKSRVSRGRLRLASRLSRQDFSCP